MTFEKLSWMRCAAGLNTRQHKMKRLHFALTSMLAVLSSGRFTNHYLRHAEQVTRGADNSFRLRDDKPIFTRFIISFPMTLTHQSKKEARHQHRLLEIVRLVLGSALDVQH